MPVKSVVRLMPHAFTRPGHRPHRLSLAAGAAAVAAAIACLAAGSAPAAPARPARPGTAGGAGPAAVQHALACGPPGYFIQCYSPGQYQVAYGVAPLLRGGITGNGETVVMPELANKPGPNFTDIRKDLAAFDSKFGLPAAKLTVTTALAGASAPYVAGTACADPAARHATTAAVAARPAANDTRRGLYPGHVRPCGTRRAIDFAGMTYPFPWGCWCKW